MLRQGMGGLLPGRGASFWQHLPLRWVGEAQGACPKRYRLPKRFIETAREIGADETQEGFEKAFTKVVSLPIPPSASEKS